MMLGLPRPDCTRPPLRPIDIGAVMNSTAPSEGTPGPGQEEPAAEPTVLRMLLGAQLRRLREAADMPAEKAGYEIRASRSKISRMETGREERDLPDVVYIEQLTSAVYLDQRADVEHYLEVADQLSGEALTPADTIRFIDQVARET